MESEIDVIVPCCERRHVIEAYPALVARRWIGKQSYKNDDPRKSSKKRTQARRDIVNAFRAVKSNGCRDDIVKKYGFKVKMSNTDAQACIDDFTGDQLDSVLCAIQAAWAYSQRNKNYGAPASVDAKEGWICDPGML